MPSKNRAVAVRDGDAANASSRLLQRIRNMWEFANLCQWIYIFGKVAKIDESLEVEDIETECLKSSSTVLSDIALALLKLASSHRGLTHEILDDQLRKEYTSKLPNENPFGDGETESCSFLDLEAPLKITVLQQLTQWIMGQPERLREKMEESKDIDQTSWRIEPYGWDADDRTYYVLDDNRVYRLSEAPELPVRKSKKQKTYGTSRRAGKRRNTSDHSLNDDSAPVESLDADSQQSKSYLGGMEWECVAITLDDVRNLIDTFRKTRDANERVLREQLDEHLLPILEKQEESRKRKEVQHQRELLSLAKMANAKRSSRIAGKVEQQREEEKAKEERERAQLELKSEQRERQKQMKLAREREFRLFSREKRLNERAARRRLHEEELAQLSEGHKSATDGRARISDRQLQSEIDRNKLALKALEEEEEDWTFDCVCGLYGQVDDGAHSVACERCSVWQHSKCVGILESEAERADFHFICGNCKRQMENATTPRKTVIILKVSSPNEPIHHASESSVPRVEPILVAPSTNLGGHSNTQHSPLGLDASSTFGRRGSLAMISEPQLTSSISAKQELDEPVKDKGLSAKSDQGEVDTHDSAAGSTTRPVTTELGPQAASSIANVLSAPSLEHPPHPTAPSAQAGVDLTVSRLGNMNGQTRSIPPASDLSAPMLTKDLLREDQTPPQSVTRLEVPVHSESISASQSLADQRTNDIKKPMPALPLKDAQHSPLQGLAEAKLERPAGHQHFGKFASK